MRSTGAGGMRKTRVAFPRAVLCVGMLVALAGCEGNSSTRKQGKHPPYQLSGLQQVERTDGSEALAAIAHLHSKEIAPLTGATVARYGKDDTKATLWIGYTPSVQEADTLVARMTGGIEAGRSPFRDLHVAQAGKITVYYLTGMGQRHAFFAVGEKVLWAAAGEAKIENVVEELVSWYE